MTCYDRNLKSNRKGFCLGQFRFRRDLASGQIRDDGSTPAIRLRPCLAESLSLDINFLRVAFIPNLIEKNDPVLLLEGHDSCYGASRRRGRHFVYDPFCSSLINTDHLDRIVISYIEEV